MSSTYLESLEALRELDPDLQSRLSVPRVKRDYPAACSPRSSLVGFQVLRARLPGQAAALIRSGGCHALLAIGAS